MKKLSQAIAFILAGALLIFGHTTAQATVMIIDDCMVEGQNWQKDAADVADTCTDSSYLTNFDNYSTTGLADDGGTAGAYGGDHSFPTIDSAVHAEGALWAFSGLSAGTYDIWATWVHASNRATDAMYEVYDDGTLLDTVYLNQEIAPSETYTDFGITAEWEPFSSSYTITSGTLIVVLYGQSTLGNDNYVIADAIRIASVPEPATLMLLGIGLLALGLLHRRRKLSAA